MGRVGKLKYHEIFKITKNEKDKEIISSTQSLGLLSPPTLRFFTIRGKMGQSYNSWFGAPGAPGAPGAHGAPTAPGAPKTLKVDRKSELVGFAEGNEIHISDFCIAHIMDQLSV